MVCACVYVCMQVLCQLAAGIVNTGDVDIKRQRRRLTDFRFGLVLAYVDTKFEQGLG